MSKHTLSVLVENKPGVLSRVSGLFTRRGFNIESLAVSPTEDPKLSRMTITVDASRFPVEQITKQLNKLVNVIRIRDLDPGNMVDRELMLLKVRVDAVHRAEVIGLAEIFEIHRQRFQRASLVPSEGRRELRVALPAPVAQQADQPCHHRRRAVRVDMRDQRVAGQLQTVGRKVGEHRDQPARIPAPGPHRVDPRVMTHRTLLALRGAPTIRRRGTGRPERAPRTPAGSVPRHPITGNQRPPSGSLDRWCT